MTHESAGAVLPVSDPIRDAMEFAIWSVSGPTNDQEVAHLEKLIEEAWQEYKTTPQYGRGVQSFDVRSSELVKRLRSDAEYMSKKAPGYDKESWLSWEAADLIEKLEAALSTPIEQSEDVAFKLCYVKRWRTLVKLPVKYADEIVEALREAKEGQSVSDEDWQRALHCAHSQMEGYHGKLQISTEAGRKAALDDAMQHAFGLLSLRVKSAKEGQSEPVAWQPIETASIEVRAATERTLRADYKMGWWLSAALEDPAVCTEMKADINAWFEAHQPGLVMASSSGTSAAPPKEGPTAVSSAEGK